MLGHMKTISLVSQKGGTGKTTLAVSLAALAASEGLQVALVDCDNQHSASAWWGTRKLDDIVMIEQPAHALPDIQNAARSDKLDLMIIDTPPTITAETMHAARAADVSLIPTRPGILDLRAISATADIIGKAGLTGCIVLNQCPPPRGFGEPTLTAEARSVAASLGLPVAPPVLSLRSAFSYALNDGQGVTEFEPTGKAAHEMRAFWSYIKKAYLNG